MKNQRTSIIIPRLSEPNIDLPCGYIYITTNLSNHKQYIGKHNKPYFDISYQGSGTILKLAQKNQNSKFITEVIDWAQNFDELNYKEQYWIDFVQAVESNTWYNLSYGGDGDSPGELSVNYGRILKESTKEKLRELNSRGKQSKENNKFYGHKHSEYTKKLISQKLQGKNNPNFNKPMSDLTKQKIHEATSGEKSHFYGVKKYGESNPFYGHKHSEDVKENLSKAFSGSKNPKAKKVVQLSETGQFIKEYDYIKQAKSDGFISENSIRKCCQGKQKLYKGFVWKYSTDYFNQ